MSLLPTLEYTIIADLLSLHTIQLVQLSLFQFSIERMLLQLFYIQFRKQQHLFPNPLQHLCFSIQQNDQGTLHSCRGIHHS